MIVACQRVFRLWVNIADIDFKYVTLVVVLAGIGLCLFYIFCMPSRNERTNESDALEQAMLLLLVLIFTPAGVHLFFCMASLSDGGGPAFGADGAPRIARENSPLGMVLGKHCTARLDIAGGCFSAPAGSGKYALGVPAAICRDRLET